MRSYEYRHRVSLEETNVIGNVYYTHYIRWQGRCREMFLRENAPELTRQLGDDFIIATTRVSCSYYQELSAFDEVLIRMKLGSMTPSRLTMTFHYFRVLSSGEEIPVADGEQEVVCLRRVGNRRELIPLPETLRTAVERYVESWNMVATEDNG
jgi:enediyne core biosynthesis thioesterase